MLRAMFVNVSGGKLDSFCLFIFILIVYEAFVNTIYAGLGV